MIRVKRGSKSEWIADAIKNLPDRFTISEVIVACPGISRPMIRVVMDELRRKGKIEVFRTGRNATWRKRDNKR